MQKSRLVTTFAAAAALACSGHMPAHSQSADVGQLLSGKTIPLTVTMHDLTGDWRVFSQGDQAGSSGYLSLIMGMARGGASDDYYTKGESMTIGGDVYLVAYRQVAPKIDISALMRSSGRDNMPKPEPVTADTALQLALVNMHTANSLTNIHPFDLQQVIAQSAESAKILTDAEDQESARSASTTSELNIRQLSYGMIQYLQDNEEKWPAMKDPAALKKLLMPYIKSESIFYQPGTKTYYMPNPTLSNHTLSQIPDPTTMVMFYESVPDKDGKRMVAYVDGHQKQLSAEEWVTAKKASKIP